MTINDIKNHLATNTNTLPNEWNMISEKKLMNGNIVNHLQYKDSSIFETVFYQETQDIRVQCLSGPLFVDNLEIAKKEISNYFEHGTIPTKDSLIYSLAPKFFEFSLTKIPQEVKVIPGSYTREV